MTNGITGDELKEEMVTPSGAFITTANGEKVAMMHGNTPLRSEGFKRRIVAALNLCAGVDLVNLRAMGPRGLEATLVRLEEAEGRLRIAEARLAEMG
jgi:hypothetical protein